MSDDISSIAAWSQGIDFGKLIVSVFAIYLISRFFDWTTGRKVRGHLDIIESDAKATAIYRGLRFAGLCYVVAAFLK